MIKVSLLKEMVPSITCLPELSGLVLRNIPNWSSSISRKSGKSCCTLNFHYLLLCHGDDYTLLYYLTNVTVFLPIRNYVTFFKAISKKLRFNFITRIVGSSVLYTYQYVYIRSTRALG